MWTRIAVIRKYHSERETSPWTTFICIYNCMQVTEHMNVCSLYIICNYLIKYICLTKHIYILPIQLQSLCANLHTFLLFAVCWLICSPVSRNVIPILSWSFFFWNNLFFLTASFRISDFPVAVVHSVLSDFCLCPWTHKYLLLGGDHWLESVYRM